ncbi:TonB-dependent receptor, partial [Phenylobacterium sp.]|uniref:TonB-dependent receptor n=1 Tax=Phenylobacterium sp. TaxID=1871053 RepID=UPI002E376B0A
VHAQTQPAAAAAASNTIEELVVTAEKRSQSLQDVPVAISAFTSERRDVLGIKSIQDMTNFTPGLEYSSQLDRISLRGVGRLTNVQSADPGVATYSDGVYTSSTVEAGKTPLFVDRVEVLRGPQGTLYGRNSIGGAINIISKRPTEDFYGEVRASYQNYDHFILEAATSGPTAIPGVQFRLGANWEKQTGGWFHNVVPGQPDEGGIIDQQYVEGQLKMKFNDNFDGWMKLAWAQWHNDGGGPGSRNGYTPGPFPTYETANLGFSMNPGYACFPNTGVSKVATSGGVSLAQACTNPASTDPRAFSSTAAASAKLLATWIGASEFTYHFPTMDLKYIGGGTHYNYSAILPSDSPNILQFTLPNFAGGPGAVVNPRSTAEYREALSWISHEVNLASTDNNPLQWLAGLYYYNETYMQPTAGVLLDQPQVNGPFFTGVTCAFTGNVCPNTVGAFRFYDDRPEIKTQSEAAYGQIDWKFAEHWKTTLGLRYTRDRKHGTESGRLVCFDQAVCLASPTNPPGFQAGFPPEVLGNFLVDLTQIPIIVTNGLLPGQAGAPGVAKGVSSLTTIDPATGFAIRHYDDHWSATTGTAGVQWDPDPDTMAYARYSRGYKAGGFNLGNSAFFGANPETNPEHVNAFEIGLKKDFGRTLQTNVAVFYYDYSNAQVPISIVPTGGGIGTTQSVFFNVPKSVSQGFELESIWQPIDHLQILFNYSYLDAHITRGSGVVDPADPTAVAPGAKPTSPGGTCAANPTLVCDAFTGTLARNQDLSGGNLPNAPKNKVAFNINYTFELSSGSLTTGATYVWRDEQYGSIFNRAYYKSPSYDQIDLRAVYKDKDNKYTVIAFVKNLLDDLGYEGGATATRRAGYLPAYALGLPGLAPTPVVQGISTTYPLTPPRTYGIELQYRF